LFALTVISSPAFSTEKPAATPNSSNIYYEVRKGDTLWDISGRYYNDPESWPGLWEQNKQIPNPHWIYPGNPIRLYGDGTDSQLPGSGGKTLEPPILNYPSIGPVGFIRSEPLPPQGEIIQFKKEGNISASEGDTVYIKANGDAPLAKGGLYRLYRTYGPVKDPRTDAFIGDQYYFTGILEIFHQDKDFYRAKILKSYRGVALGDKLMAFKPRNTQFTIGGSSGNIDGQILFSEERQATFGQHDVVYLDKGSADQISPGQIYRIYYNRTSEDITVDLDVGELVVLHAEENTATGVVVSSTKDLYAGYRFRSLRP
jgi:hypothetical protein